MLRRAVKTLLTLVWSLSTAEKIVSITALRLSSNVVELNPLQRYFPSLEVFHLASFIASTLAVLLAWRLWKKKNEGSLSVTLTIMTIGVFLSWYFLNVLINNLRVLLEIFIKT